MEEFWVRQGSIGIAEHKPSAIHLCMTSNIGWELYRSFLGVLREGSLSGAARALGITQPTAGRHVAALHGPSVRAVRLAEAAATREDGDVLVAELQRLLGAHRDAGSAQVTAHVAPRN